MSGPTPLERYLERSEQVTVREIVTPEGVPLHFVVAPPGARVWGFFLDGLIVAGLLLGTGLAVLPLVFAGLQSLAMMIFLLANFLIRQFYFVFFEIRWKGSTPGKRAARIRVIDRRGGPLRPEAVFARNLTREVEFFIPLLVVMAPTQLLPGRPGWAVLLAIAWLFIFAFLPLFNCDRLRVGDVVGGTLVVLAPKESLLGELAGSGAAGPAEPEVYEFTPEQLAIYGIYELQVLEDVLRGRGRTNPEAILIVTEKIKRKIRWSPSRWRVDPERFLRDFYAAQRARLEKRMLLGDRRESKES